MDNEDKKYLRMSLNERVQHFLLLTSFITLVITGFALKYPESLWVTGIFKLLGENAFELRGLIHRIAAVIMVVVSLYHMGYIIFHQRGRVFVKDMWFKKNDISDLTGALKYFIGKSKTRPKFGRFSYIEKAEYWAVVWGTVVMGTTGGVLWFENTFLPVISNSGMNLATAIHFYEAILASLAIFVWHFYFVIYNPDVYPMNKAWFRGYLTREEMELEHPLELEKIEEEELKQTHKELPKEEIASPVEVKEAEKENKIKELIEETEKIIKKTRENEKTGHFNSKDDIIPEVITESISREKPNNTSDRNHVPLVEEENVIKQDTTGEALKKI